MLTKELIVSRQRSSCFSSFLQDWIDHQPRRHGVQDGHAFGNLYILLFGVSSSPASFHRPGGLERIHCVFEYASVV